ncbi:ABC transporter permease [Streptomyces sp. A7024]|uniref:Transport permease protein n=1 Tax=Streptomyces coryli TaxID=1128680 RepID=A0A6G4U961_9ACTN|nr:ABC transporter permease [Streptomyces coryli]NGN68724.1 ABC transporter permease [Streptomyces coryli]
MSSTSSTLAPDSLALLGRQLQRARRNPALLVMTQAMPVMLLLFFGYVFGNSVSLPGGADYRTYLVPGVFVITAAGGLVTGMLQAAGDTQRGVMDRLRTLPVSRAAAPLGQATADVLLFAIGMIPLVAVGYAVGWRIEGGFGPAAGAFGLLLLLRFVTAWIGILVGMKLGSEEAAGQLGSVTFILQLLCNAYVPTAGMPGWLQAVVEWNPLSSFVTACRDLFGNATAGAADAAWVIEHPVVASLGWSVLLLAIFVPLAVRRYARPAEG